MCIPGDVVVRHGDYIQNLHFLISGRLQRLMDPDTAFVGHDTTASASDFNRSIGHSMVLQNFAGSLGTSTKIEHELTVFNHIESGELFGETSFFLRTKAV